MSHIRTRPLAIAVILIALTCATSAEAASNTPARSDTLPANVEERAAYCLGVAEAALSFEMRNIRAYQQHSMSPHSASRRAVGHLAKMQRLLAFLASRGIRPGGRDPLVFLEARERGINGYQECLSDQAPCIACQDREKARGNVGVRDSCKNECALPASCSGPYCGDIESLIDQ